jgi:hypothetical protein
MNHLKLMFVLSAVLVVTLPAQGSQQPGAAAAKTKNFVASPMRKVFPHTPAPARPGKLVAILFAAAGEYEAFQYVLVPQLDQPVAISKAVVSDLVGPGGTIPAPNLTVRRVAYIDVKQPSHRETQTGLFPDVLQPKVEGEVTGTTSLWVTVYVPRGSKPGLYKGTLSIQPEGVAESCAIELTVRSFELPQRPALVVAYGLYAGPLKMYYGESRLDEMTAKFRDDMRAHRVTHLSFPATDIPKPEVTVSGDNVKVDYTAFDRAVEDNVKYGLNALDVPAPLSYNSRQKKLNLEYSEPVTLKILADYQRHLKAKGWLDMSYFFVIDEPGDKDLPAVTKAYRLLKQGAPGIKRRCDFGYGAYGHSGGIEPQVAKYRNLADLFEIWVPHIDCVDYHFLKQRAAKGDWVWWYICCSSHHPYPNFLIDYPAVDNRVPFWMLHKFNVTGFAYWTVNWWTDPAKTNVFKDGVRFGNALGDGLMVYPGPDGPIDSIRWEIMRDGFEDYEYLALLSKLISKAEGSGVAAQKIAAAKAVLAKRDWVASSAVTYTNDPATIDLVRGQIAEQIESLAASMK